MNSQMAAPRRFFDKHRFRILIMVILAVLAVGLSFWQIYKYRLIRRTLGSAVYRSTDGLYRIRYDSLRLDEVNGNLRVVHLQIIPDTSLYRRMLTQGVHPPMLVQVDIPLLQVRGIRTPKAMLNKEIIGSSIVIHDPVLTLYSGGKGPDSVKGPQGPWYAQLLGSLHLISVDTVSIDNATVDWLNFRDRREMLKASAVSLDLFGLRLDSLYRQYSSQLLFSDELDLVCSRLVYFEKSGIYDYSMQGIHIDSRQKQFSADSIRVIPLLDETLFAKAMRVQKDRYDFRFAGVNIEKIELRQLMQGILVAATLKVRSSSFRVFHDLSYPKSPASKVGNYPQQLLMKLGFPVFIGQMILTDAFIEYKEKNPKSDSSGSIQFDQVSADIQPVTNIAAKRIGDGRCTLQLGATFLNLAPVRATLVMWPGDSSGRFSIRGNLGNFKASRLNFLLGPIAMVHLKEGVVDRLDFDLDCNNYHSQGNVLFRYKGIRVSVLKKSGKGGGTKENTFSSLLAGVVIKSSNPSSPGKSPRQEQINYGRDIQKSFFNLIWKSIFTGVKKTIGF